MKDVIESIEHPNQVIKILLAFYSHLVITRQAQEMDKTVGILGGSGSTLLLKYESTFLKILFSNTGSRDLFSLRSRFF